MRISLLIVVAAGLAVGADKPKGDAVKKEWARLEGTWTLTKMEVNGKSLLKKDAPLPKVLIKDGKVTGAGAKQAAADSPDVQLDPTHQPKTINIPNFKGGDPRKGVTLIGIYELKGNDLKVCAQGVETARLMAREKERPRAFDSKQGVLLIFQRTEK